MVGQSREEAQHPLTPSYHDWHRGVTWLGLQPMAWFALSPLVSHQSPLLAILTVRHGSNPYMSEQ